MVVSKTGIVLFLILFYISISVFLGFAVEDIPSLNQYEEQEYDSYSITENSLPSIAERTGFFGNIIIGYSNLPIWINILLFTPLSLLLLWIFVTSFIPTLNGGN